MNLLFIGGDIRYIKLIQNFKKEHNVYTIGYDDTIFSDIKKFNMEKDSIKNIDIIILPISGIKNDYSIDSEFSKNKIFIPKNLFLDCKENVQIFTGNRTETLDDMISKTATINTFFDNDFKKSNSLITVEGILEDLISKRGNKTIHNSNILILGYGNIGKPLVQILDILNANLCVGVLEYNDYFDLCNKNIKSFNTNNYQKLKDNIKNKDIIINTVPKHIISDELINKISSDCYILDIASFPYGFDREKVKNKNYNLYSKIPSKYAPDVSSKLLEYKINNSSKGNL